MWRLLLDMRRTLVLTNESARHPFRQSMPRPTVTRQTMKVPLSDRGLFLLTFASAFLAFLTFLG